ncbi:hypothetical protein AV650_25805 [Serratia fonticola]|nr:hypothetical protein AV650_25805 [Serratia fonticola]
MSKIIPHVYMRVSTRGQFKSGGGWDEQDRQTKAYIVNRPDVFDTENIHYITDEGVSAFSGSNVTEGKLGDFLELVKCGDIGEGHALICYSIDRLSRQNTWAGSQLISTLVTAGIEIHSVIDNRPLRKNDQVGAIISTIELMRSNSESMVKSERAVAGYQARLTKSKKNGSVLTGQMPRWLFNKNGMYAIKSEMKLVIDFIFEQYINGVSTGHIADELNLKGWQYKTYWTDSIVDRLLNANDSQMIEGKKNKSKVHECREYISNAYKNDFTLSQIAEDLNGKDIPYTMTAWRGTFVARLIRDRRLIGEHTRYSKSVKGKKRDVIERVSNFYPTAIDNDRFNIANNMLTAVAGNIRGRTRISYGDTTQLKNIFSGILVCGQCNGAISVNKNSKDGVQFIRCRNRYELKACDARDIKYSTVENNILTHLKGINLDELISSPIDTKLELLKSELVLCLEEEQEYLNNIKKRESEKLRIRPTTIQALEEVQDRIDELSREIEVFEVDNFIPTFDVELNRITDQKNVKERSLIKKGISSVVDVIKYYRLDDGVICIEMVYKAKILKHFLIIDNKTGSLLTQSSLEDINGAFWLRSSFCDIDFSTNKVVYHRPPTELDLKIHNMLSRLLLNTVEAMRKDLDP